VLYVGNKARETHLRLPGSITRTQCTGTVPKTSGEGDLWSDMEGGCVSSLNVELEQADDKESFEALQRGGRFHECSRCNVTYIRSPTLSAQGTNNVLSTGATTLLESDPRLFIHHHT